MAIQITGINYYGRLRTPGESTAVFMANLGNTADRVTLLLGYLVSDIARKQVLLPTAPSPAMEAALECPVRAETLAR
ncbi:uncharacterized protein Z518_05083 [Rhinocladiella mackenziei CBS 650.93]|uniref:Uncharacterized protein n=1 Tax=Rhinocladiella mackenziei CBS 650.93 TaxID=1442369 RepID=A0A0D2IVA3_9EURO|nr:uncharacterized protein Z518_05083 [Rhinocladiella mackenziei CBS 650.93]KIX07106.1 hypothetical protein Z518_05083 [Rhinocladiella mackenziei CBS 650.93]